MYIFNIYIVCVHIYKWSKWCARVYQCTKSVEVSFCCTIFVQSWFIIYTSGIIRIYALYVSNFTSIFKVKFVCCSSIEKIIKVVVFNKVKRPFVNFSKDARSSIHNRVLLTFSARVRYTSCFCLRSQESRVAPVLCKYVSSSMCVPTFVWACRDFVCM